MESPITEGSLQRPGTLQIQAGVKLIGHADTAMYLNQLVGHLKQEIASPCLRQRRDSSTLGILGCGGVLPRGLTPSASVVAL